MPLPPLETQRRIAASLDKETALIDTLVAEQNCLMGHLAEYRFAAMSDAISCRVEGGPGALERHPFRPPPDLGSFVVQGAFGLAGRVPGVSLSVTERSRPGQVSLAR